MAAKRNVRDIFWGISLVALLAALWPLIGPGKALVSSASFGVFCVIVEQKWNLRFKKLFWWSLSVLVSVHVIAIVVISVPNFRSGVIVVPFAVIDALAMLAIINWVDRRFINAR